MSSKRARTLCASDVHRFLDIEAAAGRDSESDTDDDSETAKEFISDDVGDAETRPRTFLRWGDLESPDILDAIARDIQQRATQVRSISSVAPSLGRATLLPTPQDPGIWRVRVQIGHECDVLLAVTQNILALGSRVHILTVFMRDFIRGSIYVEAWTRDGVHRALQGIGRVIRSRNEPYCELVALDDRVSILDMTDANKFRSIHRMSWVRITRGGKYHNQLAVVKDTDVGNFVARVLAICPSNKSRKRKGTPSTDHDEQLVELEFALADLSDSYVNSTEAELDRFRRRNNDFVTQALGAGVVPLRAGSRIRVQAGSMAGMEGRVTDVHEGNTISFEPYEANHADPSPPLPLQVLASDVRRKFVQGDFVQIMHGGHRGVEGFVVRVDDNHATISNPWQWNGECEASVLHIDNSQSNKILLAVTQSHVRSKSATTTFPNGLTPTGDPYKGIEVYIIRGHIKGRFADVKATVQRGGRICVEVICTGTAETATRIIPVDDVRERFTGLPLEIARRIPNRSQFLFLSSRRQDRVSTPTPPHVSDTEPFDPAWQLSPTRETTPAPDPQLKTSQPRPGEWLLDKRLLRKRLDVHIKGTTNPIFHGGRYEGKVGFVILDEVPSSVDASVTIRVGDVQSKRKFHPCHLFPHRQTDESRPRPIVSVIGQRVVVVGPDLSGDSCLVGKYGTVLLSQYPLQSGHAFIGIINGRIIEAASYFHEASLCRSLWSMYH